MNIGGLDRWRMRVHNASVSNENTTETYVCLSAVFSRRTRAEGSGLSAVFFVPVRAVVSIPYRGSFSLLFREY